MVVRVPCGTNKEREELHWITNVINNNKHMVIIRILCQIKLEGLFNWMIFVFNLVEYVILYVSILYSMLEKRK